MIEVKGAKELHSFLNKASFNVIVDKDKNILDENRNKIGFYKRINYEYKKSI